MKTDKHPPKPGRRVYPDELKQEAVQMLLDGHSAPSVACNLGIRHTSLLYRWKAEALGQQGQVASTLEARVRQSMSRADNVYDNAFVESCFGTIKTELEMEVYANVQT